MKGLSGRVFNAGYSLVFLKWQGYGDSMLLVTVNKSRQLLYASLIGTVRPEEFPAARAELTAQMAELSPGFHYLVDFSLLESMGLECMPELGLMMEVIGQSAVGMVVRVIPDPRKDIGMNILTAFHYPHRIKVVTCRNMAGAFKVLGF